MLEKRNIVLVTGNFNVLHPGHIRLLKFAKNFAKKLIVGIYSDVLAGENVDVKQEYRQEAVSSIDSVDKVVIINKSLEEFILEIRPDIIVKGKEYERMDNPEYDILQTYGGELVFSSGEMSFSYDSKIETGLFLPRTTRDKIQAFMQRHDITASRIRDIVGRFSEKKICVVGDIIIDEYIDCFPLGMSQEDPTIVVSPQETKRFLGGAGIVAAHASQLGADVRFLTVAGHDQARDFAASVLEQYGVDYSFVVDSTRPTTVKQRFRSQGKSLLRVSTLSQQAIPSNLQQLIFSEFEKVVSEVDLVVFSDFNYGCLPQELVDKIISAGKQHNTLITADSQSSSQVGDISRFKGADLITPTEREARLAMQNYSDGLVVLADQLMDKAESSHILLKLGEEGMIAQHSDKRVNVPHTERLEALNNQAIDVSGAGDSVLITSSMAMASKANLWEACLLGSIAAFIQVSRVGNIPLTPNEFSNLFSKLE